MKQANVKLTLIPFALFHSFRRFPLCFHSSERSTKPGWKTMFTKQHGDYEFHWIICSLFYLVFFPHFTSFNYCGSCFRAPVLSSVVKQALLIRFVACSLLVYLLYYPTWSSSWTISHLQHGVYFHYCFRVTILQLAYLSGKIIDLSLFFLPFDLLKCFRCT